MRHADDFRDTLRHGVRCGRTSLVVHARRSPLASSRAGFIVSRAVGNAVNRNRVKRRLRHLVAAALPSVPFSVDVVVRALLDAVCHAPSARGWLPGLIAYEALLLRELGYGDTRLPQAAELPELLAAFDALGQRLDRYPLAERRNDVMGARAMLRERLAKLG